MSNWPPVLGITALAVAVLGAIMPVRQRAYAIGLGVLVAVTGLLVPAGPWGLRLGYGLMAAGLLAVAIRYHRVGRYRVRAGGWFGRGDGGEDCQPGR